MNGRNTCILGEFNDDPEMLECKRKYCVENDTKSLVAQIKLSAHLIDIKNNSS
jgi:hypothetical protein